MNVYTSKISSLTNKIQVGTYKNSNMIVSESTVQFTEGIAQVTTNNFEQIIGKTLVNALAQLKSASSAVITSCRIVNSTTIEIKCRNFTGTVYTGNIGVTFLLFLS